MISRQKQLLLLVTLSDNHHDQRNDVLDCEVGSNHEINISSMRCATSTVTSGVACVSSRVLEQDFNSDSAWVD